MAITYDEWLRMPEVSDSIEEVVNGEICITPPAKLPHPRVIARLNAALVSQLDINRTYVLTGSFGLVIRTSPLTSRVPHLAVFDRSTIVEQDGYIHSAPQLVVEVLSQSNERLADYASLGVPEVWLVSPEARTVEILYCDDTELLNSGTLTPRLFPQVKVEIASIWPD